MENSPYHYMRIYNEKEIMKFVGCLVLRLIIIAVSTESSKRIPCTMELFQDRYYRINKILMSIIGLWPYQTRFGFSILAVTWFLKITLVVPQILAIVKYHDDWEIVMDCVAPLLVVVANFTKIIFCKWNSQKVLRLFNCIRTNWEVWAGNEEINIFHKYAERGRKLTIVYAVTVYLCGSLYGARIMPNIIAVLRNSSVPGEFPFPLDYYKLDAQKYYLFFIMHLFLCGMVELVVTITTDTMFIVYVQHGCGLFSALGHKLQRTGKKQETAEIRENVNVSRKKDMNYEHLTSCIDRHNDAIEYTVLIEATYSWYIFFLVGYTILGISATGIQVINHLKSQGEIIIYIAALFAVTIHVYIDSVLCQIVIDHSTSIRHYIHNSDWYKLPTQDQKLLHLMIMRCNVPCKLTAGKIFVMSVETFAAILKTSFSYFTLLRSI